MAKLINTNLHAEIAKVFGIENCLSLVIDMWYDFIATVKAEFFLEGDKAEQLKPILKEYMLVEK